MFLGKHWRVAVASVFLAATVGTWGLRVSAERPVELAAERIAGFHPKRSVAVEQAVDLMRRGDYSLALLRMNAEVKDMTVQAQARVLGAYALLVAGNTLGAFPRG